MASLDQRLKTLEAQAPTTGQASASEMYAWCASHGITTPTPTEGETVANWLTRVTNPALEAMMRLAESP